MERSDRAGAVRGHAPLLLLCLSLCFACGAVGGQVLAFRAPASTALELRQSLTNYYQNRRDAAPTPALALVTLRTWLRAPALAFLWGFTSLGVPLACLTAMAFGFLLSFSIGAFAAAFGWQGVLLCGAALGLRTTVTLPCFFLLSLSSMDRAAWLFRLSSGRPARLETRPDARARWTCAALCATVLLCGAALDLYATPRLLSLALDWLSAR